MPARGRTTAINDLQSEAQEPRLIGALNEAITSDQEWVLIAPKGVYPNPAGLQIVDDESVAAMVSAFNSVAGRVQRLFRGLPIFEGHPDDAGWAKAHPSVKADAKGRIQALRACADGLEAKIAYNDAGLQLVSGPAAAYSNQSPHWVMAPTTYKGKPAFRPVRLLSLGLTNQPNMPGTQIGLNEALPEEFSTLMKDQLLKLLAALGQTLAADASDEQISAATAAALPVAAAALASKADAEKAVEAKTAACNELAAAKLLVLGERTARAEQVLATAVNEGRLTAAAVPEWKARLIAAEDFPSVAAEVTALQRAINTTPLVTGVGGRRGEASQDRITAINEAVKTHMREHPDLQYHAAFTAVKEAKPDLFKN